MEEIIPRTTGSEKVWKVRQGKERKGYLFTNYWFTMAGNGI